MGKSKSCSRDMRGKKTAQKTTWKLETKSRASDFTWDQRGWVTAKGEADTVAQGVCERPELLFRARCCARLYISQAEIKIGIKQWKGKRGGEPPWRFKKGGEVRGVGGGAVTGWKGTGYVEWTWRLFWQQRGSRGWRMPSFLTRPDVLPRSFTQRGNQYPLFSPLGFPINR